MISDEELEVYKGLAKELPFIPEGWMAINIPQGYLEIEHQYEKYFNIDKSTVCVKACSNSIDGYQLMENIFEPSLTEPVDILILVKRRENKNG